MNWLRHLQAGDEWMAASSSCDAWVRQKSRWDVFRLSTEKTCNGPADSFATIDPYQFSCLATLFIDGQSKCLFLFQKKIKFVRFNDMHDGQECRCHHHLGSALEDVITEHRVSQTNVRDVFTGFDNISRKTSQTGSVGNSVNVVTQSALLLQIEVVTLAVFSSKLK